MRLRLFLSFLLIVLVTAASMFAVAVLRQREAVGQFVDKGGLTGSSDLVDDLEKHFAHYHSWQDVGPVMAHPHGGPGSPPALLANVDGTIIAVTGGSGMGMGMGPGGPGSSGEPDFERIGTSLSEEEISSAIHLYENGTLIGYLVPESNIVFDPLIQDSLLVRLNRAALIAAGIAAALSLVLAWAISYPLLRPIRDLTSAAHAMGEGNLEQYVVPSGGKETVALAETFNRMAGSLKDAEQRRKALTADIAHELRNPLAVQRANLEALQDGVYPLTIESLDPVVRQNLLLENLVEDLRTLALADAGHLALEIVPTDLPALVRRRLDDFAADAAAHEVTIDYTGGEGCAPIPADPGRIGQIVANLVTNALVHTPSGGTIRVRVDCAGPETITTVRDTGPGIAAEDLPHLFERFFRGDRSRERSAGSTGLGLSIARRLAEAHGGTLTAANHSDGGAEFTLMLPK